MENPVQRLGRPRSGSSPLDARLGQKIRSERILRGVSQQELARAAEVTYQQVHKYETGKNRVSIGHLLKISKALGLTIYEILAEVIAFDQPILSEPSSRYCLEHSKVFSGLVPDHQRAVHALAQTLSKL